MQYVSDTAADEVVRNSAALQELVEGRNVTLWPPGATSGLGVQALLLLGWAGLAIAVLRWLPSSPTNFGYFLGATLLSAGASALLLYRLVRGRPGARTYVFRFSAGQSVLAVAVTIGSVVLGNVTASGLATASMIMNLAAQRLVAGPGYALFAAFYRAIRMG